jgi:hypothetical protein
VQTVYVDVDPSDVSVSVGDRFEIEIRVVAGSQPVDGAEVHLDFSPLLLRAVDVQGNPVSQLVGGDTFNLTLANSVDNATGEIDFAAGTIGSPASGTFVLATIRFEALAGTAPEGTPLDFVEREQNPTDVAYRGESVLAGANGGLVRIAGSGDLPAPIPLPCGWMVAGTTAGHSASVSDYGSCGGGLVGPEVAYALTIDQQSDITVTLTTDAALALLSLEGLDPEDCRGIGGIMALPGSPAGTYYFVVDGLEAGSYALDAACHPQALEPTASPSASATQSPTWTPTQSATPSPTSSSTRSPTATSSPSASPSALASRTPTPTLTTSAPPMPSPTSTQTVPRPAHRVHLPAVLRGAVLATPGSQTPVLPSPSPTATTRATETSTPTVTSTPPAGKPPGTLDQPLLAECGARYEGATAGFEATIDGYGTCGGGMLGPEVLYRLSVDQPLDLLAIGFGAEAYLRLFVLDGPEPENCMGAAAPRSYLQLENVPAGAYFLAVDGSREAAYALTLQCYPSHPALAGTWASFAVRDCQHLPPHP